MSRVKTDTGAEARIERAIASHILTRRDGKESLDSISVLTSICQPPLHHWFQDRTIKILSLSWDEIAAGRITPTVSAACENLLTVSFADAQDSISGKISRKSASVAYDDSAWAGIGGYAGLPALAESTDPGCGIDSLAEQLRNIRHRSVAIETLRDVAVAVAGSSVAHGPSSALSAGIARLSGIITTQRENSLGDALHRAQDSAEADAKRRSDGTAIDISWGIQEIDTACPITPGGLYVLAARPGAGKTSLALQSAVASSSNGAKVGMVSLEMSAEQLATIIAGRCFGLSRAAIERKHPSITDDTWVKMRALADQWKQERRIIVMDSAASGQRMTVETIASWARINAKIGGMSYLVIDYCQLISSTNQRDQEYQTISNATRTLKTLAQSLQIPILLLSQMSREQDKVTQSNPIPRPPRCSDLRGSGSLEQDADVVAFIYDPNEQKSNPRNMQIRIDKQRAGPPAIIDLTFDGRWQVFSADNTKQQKHNEMVSDRAIRAASKPTDKEDLFK